MPATHVLTRHDPLGPLPALLDQYRHQGRWRCRITFTAPGYRYQLAEWADDLCAVTEHQDDDQRDAGGGHREADNQDDATHEVAWSSATTQASQRTRRAFRSD